MTKTTVVNHRSHKNGLVTDYKDKNVSHTDHKENKGPITVHREFPNAINKISLYACRM